MKDINSMSAIETFRVLVVDDDKSILEEIKHCFGQVECVDFELIDEPEKIEDSKVIQKTYHMIVLDTMFNDRRRIGYLLKKAKTVWPDAIVMILSNYVYDLSQSYQLAADIVLNKVNFILDPDLLCRRLMEVIPNHRIHSTQAAREFLRSIRPYRKMRDN